MYMDISSVVWNKKLRQVDGYQIQYCKKSNFSGYKSVYVKGEISNFKHHYTGHMYFTLKDENSLIKCIMFKSSTVTLNFAPKDGMKVLVLRKCFCF